MEMKIKLKPFSAPNYVVQVIPPRKRQDGLLNGYNYPLKEVPAEALSIMCDEFRKEVFAKAEKKDPREESNG